MKYILFLCVALFPMNSWPSDSKDSCTGDDTTISYSARMRWWTVSGGDEANQCKKSRTIYKELCRPLGKTCTVDKDSESTLAAVLSHAASIAQPPRVSIDITKMDTQTILMSDNWKQGTGSAQEAIVLAFRSETHCLQLTEGQDLECDASFDEFLNGLSLALFMSNVSSQIDSGLRKRVILRNRNRLAQWDAYLSEEQFQYPWELGLNFCWYIPSWKEYSSTLGRSQCFIPIYNVKLAMEVRDASPVHGWETAPEFRFIFLHPELAISYSSEPNAGDKVNAALIFEWVGAYWWNWNEDWKSADDNVFDCILDICPVGASLASAVVDLPDSDPIGHGLALHIHTFIADSTR